VVVEIGQVIINGIVLGLVYGLIAAGLTLIYGISRILNFAHGEVVMLGGFMAFTLYEMLGLNYWLAFCMGIPVFFLLGVVFYRGLFARFNIPGYDIHMASIILALGIQLLLPPIALLIWGDRPQSVKAVIRGVVSIGGVIISWERLIIGVASLVVMAVMHYFLTYTQLGRGMRAVAQDRIAAAVVGIKESTMATLSFGIACVLAMIAGMLLAPLYYVDPADGPGYLIKGLLIVVLGGLGSFPGAIAGGLLYGLAESFCYTYAGGITELIILVFVVFFLVVRPRGLVGLPWSA
jgi:branched-chain amino acid transport system permease protein